MLRLHAFQWCDGVSIHKIGCLDVDTVARFKERVVGDMRYMFFVWAVHHVFDAAMPSSRLVLCGVVAYFKEIWRFAVRLSRTSLKESFIDYSSFFWEEESSRGMADG